MKPHHNLLNRTGLSALGLSLVASLPLNAADYPTTVLSYNPLAYYRLSETAAAPAANTTANSGSMSSILGLGFPGSDLTNRPAGIVGNCYKFINPGAGFGYDGNSLLDVGWQPALNPPLGHPFTLEFWANPTAVNNDLVCAACSLNVGQSRSGYLVYLDAVNHRWEFRMGGLGSYCGTIDSAANSAVVGVWQHVVAVYDGGNLLLYLNGVKVAGPQPATGGSGYNPNNSQPFRMGATTFPNRGFDGLLDEVAFYGTNLSASTIAAHHAAATTNNAGYHAQILLDNPVGYWQMDDPPYTPPNPNTFPVTTNAGSLLTGANGTNNPGVLTGTSGPPFTGIGGNNLGIQNLYGAGNADLGNPAGLDIVGPITMIAWLQPQFTLGLRDIVAHGFGASSEVFMRINNGLYEVGSWDGTTTYSVSAAMNTGGLGSDIGNWVFLAATYDGTSWNLYRYDNLVTNFAYTTGSLSVPDAPWSIGSAGPNTSGRWFGGGIDEVAIFNTALTTAQIQQIFYSANVTPIVVTPLASQVSPPVYVGNNLNLVAAAEGNKPLSYLWTKNGVSLGNTSTSLSINNLQTSDSGTYAVIVTNPSGSTTNSVAVNVLLVPPEIVQQPAPETRYVGGTANFLVNVIGSAPLSYQWKSNGVAIGGATGTNYTLANVQPSFAANYSCTISGPGGVTNSAIAALTVLADPTASFPAAVLTDNPLGYWRLNETNGTVAHDYWNGHDGTYNGAVALGLPGFSATYDGDTAAGFGGVGIYAGGITGFDFSGTGKPFSIECWVNGPSGQPDGATMVGKGNGNSGVATTHWQFALQTLSGDFDFHIEDSNGNAADAQAPGLGPDGTWHYLVATYDGGTMTLYVDGTAAATAAGPATGPAVTSIPMSIGAGRSGVTPIYDQPFTGSMDEVAVYNYALSSAQVLTHALAGFGSNTRPYFTAQPQSVTNYVTYAETFTVNASGTPPLSYQWYKNGSPLSDGGNISGSTTRALSIDPLDTPDTGNYFCAVSNTVGGTNSATAHLTVLTAPTTPPAIAGLVLHLTFDNNLSDVTGRGNNGTGVGFGGPGPTFVSDGKLGQGLHYATATSNNVSGNPVTSSSYVTLGARPDLLFSSNVNFSVAFWVRMPDIAGTPDSGDLPWLTDVTNSTFGNGFVFAPSYKLGGLGYSVVDLTGNGIGAYGESHTLDDGTWHHVAFVIDRINGNSLYLDGRPAYYTNQSNPSGPIGNLDFPVQPPTCIGQDPTGQYPEPGSSDIDDLGVWRKALSAQEVAAIYLAAESNSVSYVGAPIVLTSTKSGNNLIFNWNAGELQSATDLTGPWVNVSPVPPYTAPIAGPRKFYRVKL